MTAAGTADSQERLSLRMVRKPASAIPNKAPVIDMPEKGSAGDERDAAAENNRFILFIPETQQAKDSRGQKRTQRNYAAIRLQADGIIRCGSGVVCIVELIEDQPVRNKDKGCEDR